MAVLFLNLNIEYAKRKKRISPNVPELLSGLNLKCFTFFALNFLYSAISILYFSNPFSANPKPLFNIFNSSSRIATLLNNLADASSSMSVKFLSTLCTDSLSSASSSILYSCHCMSACMPTQVVLQLKFLAEFISMQSLPFASHTALSWGKNFF